MDYTENYQLSLWDMTDAVKMNDFNSNHEKIDAAITALNAQIAACGNCRIVTGTYTGTGTYNKSATAVKLPLEKCPALLLLTGSNCGAVIIGGKVGFSFNSSTSYRGMSVTWNDDNTISWLSSANVELQLNYESVYTYYAFYL